MFLLRKILFIFLLTCLLLPVIQNTAHLINIKPLSGLYTLVDDTTFTMNGWFSEKYQTHENTHLRDNFGLRSLFIRLRNQLDYTFFRETHTDDFVVGKDDDIFWGWYLKSYTGTNFLGSKALKDKLDTLKYMQDELAKRNKTLLIVIAPSKPLFNPGDIPERFKKGDSTNYEAGIKILQKEGLNYIDFNSYFVAQKTKSKYPLFYKYGSHWTDYGAFIAGDSICAMVESLRKIKMPHANWKSKIDWQAPKADELDMEEFLNLVFSFKHDLLAHPEISHPADTNLTRPSALVVGDSYFWALRDEYNFWDYFSSGVFCYYYSRIFPRGVYTSTDIIHLKDELKKDDVFIVEITEANFGKLGFDFPQNIYPLLNSDTAGFNQRVIVMRNKIKSSGDWMKTIVDKAARQKIPVDSMVTLDAIWMVQRTKN